MPPLNGPARLALLSGLMVPLAVGLMAGDALASPIPTQITYSTSGPEPLKTSAGDVGGQKRGGKNGAKTGTLLISHAD